MSWSLVNEIRHGRHVDANKWLVMLEFVDKPIVLELENPISSNRFYIAKPNRELLFGDRDGLKRISKAGLTKDDVAEYIKSCQVTIYENPSRLPVRHPYHFVPD